MTRIIANPDTAVLMREGAAAFIAELAALPPNATVALCGGRSVEPFLHAVYEWRADVSNWGSLRFFLVDERIVAPEDPASNFRLLREVFFEPMLAERLIDERQLHPFLREGILPDVRRYGEELGADRFDVAVLGAGEDGHVAALFPGHPALGERSHCFLTLSDSPKPPPHRMTASLALLAATRCVYALVLGEAKQAAFERYCDPTIALEDCPLKVIDSAREAALLRDKAPVVLP